MVTTSDKRKKSKMEVSADWYITVKYWRLSSMELSLSIIRLVNYSVTTSLIYRYIL